MTDNAAITNFEDLLIGRKLGGCLIQSQVGRGGMATVYSGIRDRDESLVAVKVINNDLNASEEAHKRFQREARLMSMLQHPHILPVYDYGSYGAISYLVMQFLAGGSLNELLARQRLKIPAALELIEQIGAALDYAHAHGIVHRDLKPANVLLDKENKAYLTDFGIAKWVEETTGLTLTGMVVGTPAYMSPEQWRTEPVDARTDVYSFGIMIFQMLTGNLPYVARTPFSLMYKHLDEPPPSVRLFNSTLPLSTDLVIERALAKNIDGRYESAGELVNSLKNVFLSDNDNATMLVPVADGDKTPVLEENTLSKYRKSSYQHDPIDHGAETLISRARETALNSTGDLEVLARAVIRYVQNLQEQAKYKPRASESPYKALESYDVVDNKLFFGREVAIDAMLERAPFAKFTALHAESGAGKTSLIRAGLMPRLLAGGFLPLYVAVRRRPPHEALKHLLLPDLTEAPRLGSASLHTYLQGVQRAAGDKREIFIFFDQFETFFTDVFTDEQRDAFIRELAEALDDSSLRLRVTVSLRTEYFGLLARFQPLIQPFEKEFLLRRLTLEEAERAMVKPVEAQGYSYEEGLVKQILQDLADESHEVAPPQLQLVGTALIEQMPSGQKEVTIKSYQGAGGARGVLHNYLERLLSRLPVENRRAARLIIEGLVRGDMTRDVRSAASLEADLVAMDVSTENFDTILRTLRENHILRVIESSDGLAYELVHDYLALQIQLDPDVIARKAAQELLDRGVQDYEKIGSLLSQEELGIIKSQSEGLRLNEQAKGLIERSEHSYHKQRRLTRLLVTSTIIGVIVTMAIGLLASLRESANQKERLEAQQTSEARIANERDTGRIAESRRLADLSQQQLAIDSMVSLNLALEAFTPRERPYVPEAELALSRAVQAVNEIAYMPSTRKVHGALWNSDETRVLTWSNDQSVRVFEAETGVLLAEMLSDALIISATWSADESQVLAGDNDGNLYVIDASSGEIAIFIQAALGDNQQIAGVSWSPQGTYFAAWNNNNVTGIWGADGKLIAIIEGNRAVWSHDGERLVTIYTYNPQQGNQPDNVDRLFIWDARSGNLLNTLDGHVNLINGAVWSLDDQAILSWGNDTQVIIWDSESGEIKSSYQAGSEISQASWSPDESHLMAMAGNGTILLWQEFNSDPLILEIEGVAIKGGSWDAEGDSILVFGEQVLGIWAIDGANVTPLLTARLSLDNEQIIMGAYWSPDKRFIAIYSNNGKIYIIDAGSMAIVGRMDGHQGSINSIFWSEDGTKILSTGDDGSARIWCVIDNGLVVGHGELQRFISSESAVLAASWNAQETKVAASFEDGSIRIWDINGALLYTLEGHNGAVSSLVWDSSGDYLASAGSDGELIVWDANTGKAVHTLVHTSQIWSVSWDKNGQRLLSSSDDGHIRVWSAVSGGIALDMQQSEASIGVGSAIWNRDQTRILAASDDGVVQVWDATTGALILRIVASNTPVYGARWSEDEQFILLWGVVGFNQPLARVYDAESGDELFRIEAGHSGDIIDAAWSPDGRMIATASRDGTARIWNASTGQSIFILAGHSDAVTQMLWNRDGSRIMTRSVDGQARVWDTASGIEILRLSGHFDRVNAIAWSVDERRILTASHDGSVRIWQAWPDLNDLLDQAEILVTRPLSSQERAEFFLPTLP